MRDATGIARVDKDEQDSRAFLRERFLRLVSQLQGQECVVKTQEKTEVTCKIRSFEPTMQNIIVENLKTPTSITFDQAILRTGDIKSIHFDLNPILTFK